MLDRGLNKHEWLGHIKSERARWDELLRQVGRERLTEPGVTGDWSVKDLIAHTAYWEELAVRRLEAAARGEAPAPNPDASLGLNGDDEYNALIYSRHKDKPLDEVLSHSQSVYKRLVAAVEALPEDALADPGRYTWMKGNALWEAVPGNSYEHYADHINGVRSWLERVPA